MKTLFKIFTILWLINLVNIIFTFIYFIYQIFGLLITDKFIIQLFGLSVLMLFPLSGILVLILSYPFKSIKIWKLNLK